MPRQARLDVPDPLHHVLVRGLECPVIFRDDTDRDDVVACLAALAEQAAFSFSAPVTGAAILAAPIFPSPPATPRCPPRRQRPGDSLGLQRGLRDLNPKPESDACVPGVLRFGQRFFLWRNRLLPLARYLPSLQVHAAHGSLDGPRGSGAWRRGVPPRGLGGVPRQWRQLGAAARLLRRIPWTAVPRSGTLGVSCGWQPRAFCSHARSCSLRAPPSKRRHSRMEWGEQSDGSS